MAKGFILPHFELVSEYAGQNDLLPQRATENSAGYDFVVAKDTVLWPAITQQLTRDWGNDTPKTLDEIKDIMKTYCLGPTLVPTGVRAYMPGYMYLQLSVRSSCPLKYGIILANGVGIVDADYYSNPDNEGHIYFQLWNLSPYPIQLLRGDKIGQGIFLKYQTDGTIVNTKRAGGFGSTTTNIEINPGPIEIPAAQEAYNAIKEVINPHLLPREFP